MNIDIENTVIQFGSAVREIHNLDTNIPIDIYSLNITKEKNGWNKVSFFYKIED